MLFSSHVSLYESTGSCCCHPDIGFGIGVPVHMGITL